MNPVKESQTRLNRVTQTSIGVVFLFLVSLVASCGSSGGGDGAMPLGNDASLSSLSITSVTLQPVFSSSVTDYTAEVGFALNSTQVTATPEDINATVVVNGSAVAAGAASDPIQLDEGYNTITVNVTAEDGSATQSYTVVVTRQSAAGFAQTAYVKASNTGYADSFGYSGAVSGNGSTLAVGAHHEDSAATGVNGDETDNSADSSGAVYIFRRDDAGTWTQEAYVKASNTERRDWFGYSVALSGDGSTLAVSARHEDSAATGVNGDETDNSAQSSGAVYIFRRNNAGVWSQQAYVKASNTNAADNFGKFVSLSGDGTILAVGAHGEDSAATGVNGDQSDNSLEMSGAVYVFGRNSSDVWTQQAYIKASYSDAGDQLFGDWFGFSGAVSKDGLTLAVGAVGEDSAATGVNGDETDNTADSTGAVYVFTRENSDAWTQQAYIKASNADIYDSFGESLALAADGLTLAVGAHIESSAATGVGGDEADNTAAQAGAVYVFVRDDVSDWSQQAYVKASNTGGGDWFGRSVSLSGDGSALSVAAYWEDSATTGVNGDESDDSAPDSGAAYIFTRDSVGVWAQRAYVKASNTNGGYFCCEGDGGEVNLLGNSFGKAVALSADGASLVVGAPGERSAATGVNGDETDTSAGSSGAVYVFEP